jgi:serine/threonine protein kinase
VQALAVGEDDGTCYMAMTYINGETVKARLKRDGKFEVDEALHIVQQVAEALYYAWDEAGMIHRDVKPDNIMITDDGIVKLTDLGLAMQQTEWREDMEISGSPSYMSPEQFTGDKLDSRSDIYSLGVTLYQMISGILPFDGQTVKSVAKQHFEEEAVPLNKRDPKVPPKVAQFVSRMMAKNPEDRFKDLEELLHGIWNLRQKTAPDTSLVPDVHTISIKRLDYEMQNDLLEKKKAHGARRRSASSFLERLDYVKVALIARSGGGPLRHRLGALLGRGGNAESGKVVQSLDYYKRLCSDKTMDPQELVKEGDKILADLGPLANFEQSEAILRFKTLYAEAGRRKASRTPRVSKSP